MILCDLSVLRHNLSIESDSRPLRESAPTGLRSLVYCARVLQTRVSNLPVLVRVPGLLTRICDLIAVLVRVLHLLLAGVPVLIRVHLSLVPVLVG